MEQEQKPFLENKIKEINQMDYFDHFAKLREMTWDSLRLLEKSDFDINAEIQPYIKRIEDRLNSVRSLDDEKEFSEIRYGICSILKKAL